MTQETLVLLDVLAVNTSVLAVCAVLRVAIALRAVYRDIRLEKLACDNAKLRDQLDHALLDREELAIELLRAKRNP